METPTEPLSPEDLAAAEVARTVAAEAALQAEKSRRVSISAALRLAAAESQTKTVEADGFVFRVSCGRPVLAKDGVRQRLAVVAASQPVGAAALDVATLGPAEQAKRAADYLELCREVACSSIVGIATAIDGIAHSRLPFEAITVVRLPASAGLAEGFVSVESLSDAALMAVCGLAIATDGRSLAEQIAPFRG